MSHARETTLTFFIMYLPFLLSEVYLSVNRFYTLPHNSGGVLWFHIGRPCVCPSVHRLSVRFSFSDANFSKHQWVFTKLGMCIYIVEIWFGIADGQISPNFYGVTCLRHSHIFVSV